jgi:hypothetical protein
MKTNIELFVLGVMVTAVFAVGLIIGKNGVSKADPAEYQFVVVDDSIIVKDFDKSVGKVKLEGELLKLIDQDNE